MLSPPQLPVEHITIGCAICAIRAGFAAIASRYIADSGTVTIE
jgi:hypothetical protein